MSMVCGLDLHRGQITFDALQVESGEVWRGRVRQPDRARFRQWLTNELAPRAKDGPVEVVVEGRTGWALCGGGGHRGGLRRPRSRAGRY